MLNSKKKGYYLLLLLILIASSIPVFCMYVMEGGMAEQSIARLSEFALFLRISLNIRWIWVALLFFIQITTMGGALLLFHYLYSEQSGTLWGVLLYMTLPCRIYLCYDLADLSQAFAWMLLPYYLWSLLHVVQNKKRHLFLWVSALFLAGIGYVEASYFPIALGLTLLLILISRNGFPVITMVGGTLLALPGLRNCLSYLSGANSAGWDIPLTSIMPQGYAVGELFSAFIYADGKPGIGLGLLFVFALLIYFRFVERQKLLTKREVSFVGVGIFLLLLSLRTFPWDYLQRISPVFLRMISLFQTPGVFLYFACFAFTIPAAGGMQKIYEKKDKYISAFLAVLLLILCLGTTVYQCNTYIFTRLPLPV